MKNYCKDLGERVLARQGCSDLALVNDTKVWKRIKDAVIRLAPLCCSSNQMMVLFWLLDCDKNWNSIWEKYNNAKCDVVALASVRRRANSAKRNIVKAALGAEEFSFLLVEDKTKNADKNKI